jgi:hypothetical protein
MATSTTIKPKAPATSDLQAINWGKLFKDAVNLLTKRLNTKNRYTLK